MLYFLRGCDNSNVYDRNVTGVSFSIPSAVDGGGRSCLVGKQSIESEAHPESAVRIDASPERRKSRYNRTLPDGRTPVRTISDIDEPEFRLAESATRRKTGPNNGSILVYPIDTGMREERATYFCVRNGGIGVVRAESPSRPMGRSNGYGSYFSAV